VAFIPKVDLANITGTYAGMLAIQVVGDMDANSSNAPCFGDISVDLVLREE